MRNFQFTILLEQNLKKRLPESSDRRRLRLELCEVFGFDTQNKIESLNQRCKRGTEPTASQLKGMIKAFGRYGIGREEIFDKDQVDNESKN